MMSRSFTLRMTSLALVVSLAGCAATEQTTSAKASGFLGDYSALKKGQEGEAQLLFLDLTTPFEKYDSIQLESITYWVGDEKDTQALDPEVRKRMTDRLYQVLYDRLSKDYKMVDRAGPSVLRIRGAITETQGAKVVLNAITSTIPQLRLLSQLGDLDDDTALLVGKASVECEILDSTTGKRIAAAVDERMGNKTLKTSFTKWGDVDASFEFWANRLAERLGKLRRGDKSPVTE